MSKKLTVLAVDDDASFLRSLVRILKPEPVSLLTIQYPRQVMSILRAESVGLILLDLKMPDQDGLSLLGEIKSVFPDIPVVMLTGQGGVKEAVTAVKHGADDFIEKPCPPIALVEIVRIYSARLAMTSELVESQTAESDFPGMVGQSAPMQKLKEIIVRVAQTNATILLHGETGTGKELVAQAIHAHSLRKHEAFVPVDCATISENILESELFGHKQGAFTGAVRNRDGLFVAADRGTLFLDEIGEFDLSLQAKLLRTLQERQIRPIGSNRVVSTNIRLIAATNKDLEEEAEQGAFREDLYHRLSAITLQIPPLRDRSGDLPMLIQYILKSIGADNYTVSEEALRYLTDFPWPGNVRQLQNVIIHAVALSLTNVLECSDLPVKIMQQSKKRSQVVECNTFLAHERIALDNVLKQTGGNRREAAKLLNISEATLYRKLKKTGLSRLR